jgi:cystathionine beta-lyase/cystathionine gamma-synthase
MSTNQLSNFIKSVIDNMPTDWLRLTTHRLDIYNESLAKTEFLDELEKLYSANDTSSEALAELPTAFDYIRLGHPLSSVLEWAIAKQLGVHSNAVISFSSQTMPLMAVLRKNLFDKKSTLICYKGDLPKGFEAEAAKIVYGYNFELKAVDSAQDIPNFNGSVVYVSADPTIALKDKIDFYIQLKAGLGSVIVANSNDDYISEIQHVRRRESIAMTPANCVPMLAAISSQEIVVPSTERAGNKASVEQTINEICGTHTKALVGSSGLSIQYAIMMGLVDYAQEHHPGKDIKFIVPPNCYGGTNDQARRVAACLENVEIVDFPVDAGNDMVQSIDRILDEMAEQDAVPYIIAEIPTNPRVEVPDLEKLRDALTKERKNIRGEKALDPVFILDQTFCPNFHFLGENDILSSVKTLAYISGSKFPSGGLCTAGYCVPNKRAEEVIDKIEKHLILCDNEATDLQLEILAKQMPSMVERIADAYANTREFVNFIQESLPAAKINFVSEELAAQGFTPSVFSLDLPTKGNSDEEREAYKRELNLKLINMMISEIPNESKYCVSYGQLKGCYWTIPATSTQGTTKESDKDYIARVAVAPELDLDKHKQVFADFVSQL